MFEFFKNIILFLNENAIEYMLSGSVALSVYTLPRATRDFDFIVHLNPGHVSALVNHFKEGYYCDEDSVREAVNNKSLFNIIDYHSGYKADFVILKEEVFRQTEFRRRQKIILYDLPVYIVSPEDLLISKLIWIQDYQSNLHIDDIKNLITLDSIDKLYINDWIQKLKLNTFDILE
jgi:hypothetical protein